MVLISLTGAKGCGKSTVGAILVADYGFRRMRFADALKRMVACLGLTQAQIEGAEKELPCPLLGGKTPRQAMQTLGTEWGRAMIDKDLWVRALQTEIVGYRVNHKGETRIVVDDLRFPNEHAMIRSMGGVVWRIRRPVVEPKQGRADRLLASIGLSRSHASESFWARLPADEELWNVETPDHLARTTRQLVEKHWMLD